MSDLVHDLSDYLVSIGICAGLGNDLFLDSRPDNPDDLTVIYESGGFPSEKGLESEETKRTLQILCRSKSQAAVRQRIWKVYNELNKGNAIQINGRCMVFVPLQTPFLFNRDNNDRVNFAFNTVVYTQKD